jgi:UDP-glucose 6-dehydrogenase
VRVSVFGLGYVGSVLWGCLAEAGNEVMGVDVGVFRSTVSRGRRGGGSLDLPAKIYFCL